jgi:hypothetical protein
MAILTCATDGCRKFSVGDSPSLADGLAALLLAGRKVAACGRCAPPPPHTSESEWCCSGIGTAVSGYQSRLRSLLNGGSAMLMPPAPMMRAEAIEASHIGHKHTEHTSAAWDNSSRICCSTAFAFRLSNGSNVWATVTMEGFNGAGIF